nr:hypothetical protein [Tanacetum cinerariifolium]
MRFGTVNYRKLITRLSRPPGAAAVARRTATRKANSASATPAFRELLLAADGSLTWDIDRLELPVGEP